MKHFIAALLLITSSFCLGQESQLFVPNYCIPKFNNDSSYAITYTETRIEIWNIKTNKLQNIIDVWGGGKRENYWLNFYPSFNHKGNVVYFNRSDSFLIAYDIVNLKQLYKQKLPIPILLNQSELSPNDDILIANNQFVEGKMPTTLVIDFKNGEILNTFHDIYKIINFNKDGSKVLLQKGFKKAFVYNVLTNSILPELTGQESKFDHTGNLVLSYTNRYNALDTLWLYNANDSKLIDYKIAASYEIMHHDYGPYDTFAYRFIGVVNSKWENYLWDIEKNKTYSLRVDNNIKRFIYRLLVQAINKRFADRGDITELAVQEIVDSISAYSYYAVADDSRTFKIYENKYIIIPTGEVYEISDINVFDVKNNQLKYTIKNEQYSTFETSKPFSSEGYFTTKAYCKFNSKQDKENYVITNIYDVETGVRVFKDSLPNNTEFILAADSVVFFYKKKHHYLYNYFKKDTIAKFNFSDNHEGSLQPYLNIIYSKITPDSLLYWLQQLTSCQLNKYDIYINNVKLYPEDSLSWIEKIRYKHLYRNPANILLFNNAKNVCLNAPNQFDLLVWNNMTGQVTQKIINFFDRMPGGWIDKQVSNINELDWAYYIGNHGHGLKVAYFKKDSVYYDHTYSQYENNRSSTDISSYDGKYILKNLGTKKNIINKNTKKVIKTFSEIPNTYPEHENFSFHIKPELFSYSFNGKYYLINLIKNKTLAVLDFKPSFIDTSGYYSNILESNYFHYERYDNSVPLKIKSLYNSTVNYIINFKDTFRQKQLEVDTLGKIKIVALDSSNSIHIFDIATKKWEKKISFPKQLNITDINYKNNLVVAVKDNQILFYQLSTAQLLYTYIPIDGDNFIVYDSQGHYDASPNALQHVYYSCGNKVVPASKTNYKSRVPGLVQKIMSNQKQLINAPNKNELNICNLVN